MKFVEMYLFLLTPCDFLQQWSQGVSMSRDQNICAHLCWAWMMSIRCGVFQLDVELHLLVEDLISSVSAEVYVRLYLVWSDFSPYCSHLGRRVVYQVPPLFMTLYCRNIKFSDTFVISKCMWQICNVLQICDSKLLVQIL